MSHPLQEFSPSQLNKRRQASIFDFGATKKRRHEYPPSPPSSSPIKRTDDYTSAEFSTLEKSPVPFEIAVCLPSHLRSGINSLSHNASFLSRLQWREMDGLRRHIMTQNPIPHRYAQATGIAVAIEDCPLPVLCGISSSSTNGFWIGTQDGKAVNVNKQLQHVNTIQMHNNAILDMSTGAGLPDFLATASGDKSVILWETAQNEDVIVRQYFCGNGGSVRKVASHDSAQLLAAASRSGSVTVIDARSEEPIMNLHANAHHTLFGKGPRLTKIEKAVKPGLTAIDWITDTTLATACGTDSEIRIWDTRYLKQDGHSGIMFVEGRASKPVALFKSEEKSGVTDLHYDKQSNILYSVGHKSVCGYSCNYGAYLGMDTVLSPNLDSWQPPVVSAPVEARSFYSGSAITDGYLAVGEGSETVNVFSLPDSLSTVSRGMEGRRVAADASGSMTNVNGAMEVAALSWVDGTLMGCTDAGVVFRVDEKDYR
jgi:WD40 repeat protein